MVHIYSFPYKLMSQSKCLKNYMDISTKEQIWYSVWLADSISLGSVHLFKLYSLLEPQYWFYSLASLRDKAYVWYVLFIRHLPSISPLPLQVTLNHFCNCTQIWQGLEFSKVICSYMSDENGQLSGEKKPKWMPSARDRLPLELNCIFSSEKKSMNTVRN